MATGIYCITNCLNGKKYVGQAINISRRWRSHKSRSVKGISAIHLALHHVGISNFSFEILEECGKEALNDRECFWIEYLDTIAPKGYNLNSGGKCPLVVSEETRRKQSIAQQGKVHPREVVEKRRQAVLGSKRTAETKMKISIAHKGKKLTQEHRVKLSNAHKGKPAHNKGVPMTVETKAKIIKAKLGNPAIWKNVPIIRNDGAYFASIKEAAEQIGASRSGIMRVLGGSRKSVYGWSFSYTAKVGV